ncbi:MAG: SDR family NAD(P)-dependent oxidoreductase [Pacificimonas sp.]
MPTRRDVLIASASAAALAGTSAKTAHHEDGNMPDLSGKSVLITGASSGFGYLGAQHYARAGATVVASMRNLPRPEADALLRIVADGNLDIHIVEIDVLDDASVMEGVAEAERLVGGTLDVVINNAGIGMGGPVEISDMEAAQLMFGTNVLGAQRVSRAALPKMRAKGGGVIVNISSQLGRVMFPNLGLYSATKFALEAMSEQMAYELAPRGVELTIIQPGGYPTEIWEKGNRHTQEMLARADDERKTAYAELVENAFPEGTAETDPMDVPRAIAGIVAMPAGQRPLRLAVHPGPKPQLAINHVSAKTQSALLGGSPYAAWAKDVLS